MIFSKVVQEPSRDVFLILGRLYEVFLKVFWSRTCPQDASSTSPKGGRARVIKRRSETEGHIKNKKKQQKGNQKQNHRF